MDNKEILSKTSKLIGFDIEEIHPAALVYKYSFGLEPLSTNT